jgi:hypothetical protein
MADGGWIGCDPNDAFEHEPPVHAASMGSLLIQLCVTLHGQCRSSLATYWICAKLPAT